MNNFPLCVCSRQGVPPRVLLRHLQPRVAEQTPNLQLQAPVDPDESQRRGPHRGLQTRLQTGEI